MPARDIVDVLLDEHQQLRAMLIELIVTDDPEDRQERFRALVATLASHEAAEQAIVHPTVREDVPTGDGIADTSLEQESSAEELIAEMEDLDVSSAGFTDALDRLRGDVLAHAEHEEAEEFPLLREHLDEERRHEMGRRFERLREIGPTRAHPHTPASPAVRGVAGPVVGLFDRARDAVREAIERE